MKTVGEILAAARREKGWSIGELSRRTKIQEHFLLALESSDVARLPEAPFVKGFIRAIASELGLSPESMVATFRRDFEITPRGSIVPRTLQDSQPRRWSWSPKVTLFSALALVTVAFAAYLGVQLRQLTSPPMLIIVQPKDNEVVSEEVVVEGRTDPTATVSINDQPIKKNRNGTFSQVIRLSEGSHTLSISAVSQNGKATTQERTVHVKSSQTP